MGGGVVKQLKCPLSLFWRQEALNQCQQGWVPRLAPGRLPPPSASGGGGMVWLKAISLQSPPPSPRWVLIALFSLNLVPPPLIQDNPLPCSQFSPLPSPLLPSPPFLSSKVHFFSEEGKETFKLKWLCCHDHHQKSCLSHSQLIFYL